MERLSAGGAGAPPGPNGAHGGKRVELAHASGFTLGTIRFEPSTRQLHADGSTETLEPRVMQVLALLAGRRGQVVSRDELVERCWEGRAVSEDAINRAILKVRRIAETWGGFDLETIPRVGYRLAERSPEPGRLGRARTWLSPRFAIAVVLILGLLAGAAWWKAVDRRGPAQAEPVSLAVLPFRNLSSGDPFFAEGVAEEILTQLARQPGLRVAGRTSSWLFRDNADPREVGRSLDVAYVLEGSVRRDGQEVRVDVALVDTRDGMRRWSRDFEGSLDDIFAIQREIGSTVTGQLRQEIVLTAPAPESLRTRGDAYNLYLVARGFLRTREPAKIEAAWQLLQAAVALDPDYAPALAALGTAYALAPQAGSIPGSPESHLAEARRHIERALALAPDLPEGLIALSMISLDQPTRQRLERAVQVDPTNAEMWQALSRARANAMDFEGELDALRRAASIDPFWVRSSGFAVRAWTMGERREATAYLSRLMRHHPEAWARQLAGAHLAAFRHDWSEAYRLSLEADRLRPPLVRPADGPSGANPIALRIRLGRLEEAARIMRLPVMIELMRGSAPRLPAVLEFVGGPAAFWQPSAPHTIIVFRLLQHDRGADLLALYDRVFSSPEQMLQRHPGQRGGFLDDAPLLAVALRQAGRQAEADRMLSLADRVATAAMARGRVPYPLLEQAARVRAVQGRREDALRLLERAVAMGWQFDELGLVPRLADLPVYQSIRSEPRLLRIDRSIQQAVARERRETEALRL